MNNLFKVILDFPRPFGAALRVTQKGYGKIFNPRCGFAITNIKFLQRFHPRWGVLVPKYINLPSKGSPLAPAHFQWRKNGKNAVDLCNGIGLGMLSNDHPIKRDDLMEDILDNKAFYPCDVDGAKSHLKWAEGFTDSSCFWYP
ncbi:hypothetical protein [Sphingobacterium sp.]|uniref:hypothetical protein n=1 Tax=Sphingobacterium sp. TaxID=341027 RepID=UPI0028AACC98|nr:hypothetical protein [Sphingobacterium sp.]